MRTVDIVNAAEGTPPTAGTTFGPIALGLSGGGYRAAAFHLGALDLLHRVGLLNDVSCLSTVSGGSITGARWAMAMINDEPFETFFKSMYGFLADTDCIQAALGIVGAARKTPSRRVSLITAAAEVYATHLVPGITFGDVVTRCPQLSELTFNTTEFQSGLDFRFQKSQSAGAPIGNNKYRLDPAAAKLLRLGDIVAASSCFPGGFEPIGFPDDFVWPGGAPPGGPSATRNALGRIPYGLALMDGGIYDNQGIDALILAQKRALTVQRPFGLVIVSDADQDPSLFSAPPQPPPGSPIPAWAAHEVAASSFHFEPVTTPGWLSFPVLRAASLAISALAFLSALDLAVDLARSGAPTSVAWLLKGFRLAVLLVVAAAGVATEWWLRSKVKGQFAPKVLKLWGYLRGQKLTVAKDLVLMRGRSLFALSAKVFMRRIRSLSVTRLLTEPVMKDLALTNEIHDLLSCSRDWNDNPRYSGIPPPSAALLACARTAHEMDTLLWFQNHQQLPSLIATGQATLCFNLLVHVQGGLLQLPESPGLLALEQRLLGVWATLAATPKALLTGRVPL